jgi:type VI secretion system protein ImpG
VDKKFLDYYNKELIFMREMSREFAEKHPKIAGRLGMRGIEVADPYVERLIESFCFLSARTQLKLDAEFPNFTQRLLDIVYPNYTAPTPAMGVIQLTPNLKEGDLTQGHLITRGSTFFSAIPAGESTRCEFRNAQDVQLWPLEICEAQLTSIPPDMPNLEKHHISWLRLKGALRIKLKLQGELVFSQLSHLDKLPIYIDGDERIVSHLFELLHAHHVATIIRTVQQQQTIDTVISQNALAFTGLEPDQSLLPQNWNIFNGHNLVQEYFSCRQRFYFFTLTQLSAGLRENHSNEAEIIILLDNIPQDLAGHVTAQRFLLFCTPVINLFTKRIDKIEIDRSLNEFHVVADRSRPLDYEIFSISKVFGQQAETSQEVIFQPLYQTRHNDKGNFGRYFSITRKNRYGESNNRKYDTRTSYDSSEVFISLVDQQEAPYSDNIRYLSIEAWVTNRDLPGILSTRSEHISLTMPDAAPITGARFVFQPSAPRAPFAKGEMAWRLIRQLSLNFLPLYDMNHRQGGEALRNILRLFVSHVDHDAHCQIDALVACHTEPVIRRLPGNGLLVYGRGIACDLTVDEEGFSGVSPYLFGMIMENYIARHAAINVFTETRLSSIQRGQVGCWQGRPGKRGVL